MVDESENRELADSISTHFDIDSKEIENKSSSELMETLAAIAAGSLEDDDISVVIHYSNSDFISRKTESLNNLSYKLSEEITDEKNGLLYTRLSSEAVVQLMQDPDVHLIEVDYPGELELDVSIPTLGSNSFRDAFGLSGKNIKVAVLDDAIDTNHIGLHPRVIQKRNYSSHEWQDIGFPSQPSHATMVAGIIGGSGAGSDSNKLEGVAPKVIIWNYRIVPLMKLNGRYTSAGVVQAIIAAADDGADIINLSWGKLIRDLNGQSDLCKAVEYAANKGVVIVKSAGNKDTKKPRPNITTPGDSVHCITVGALSNNGDSILEKSSVGPTLHGLQKPDLVAPGGSIDGPRSGGDYETSNKPHFHSTSFAAPHISGVVALIKEKYTELEPREITELLFSCCEPIAGSENDPEKYGLGITNLRAIVILPS